MNSDLSLLIRDKYDGDASNVTDEDRERLARGEPLAYVIGWIPFLGLRIGLSSKPLIPRPETEWWTEELIAHLKKRFGDEPFTLLDLCAGSGAIGLSVLQALPHAHVSFGELVPEHADEIRQTLEVNNLDAHRANIRTGDLFEPFGEATFDVIVTNPPYIPSGRTLDASVTNFEPHVALTSGIDGLELIRLIAVEAPSHLNQHGELWMEADIENINQAAELLIQAGARETIIRTDLYDRPRIVLAYY